MHHKILVSLVLIVLVLVPGCMKTASQSSSENKYSEDVERGRYVVEIMGCNDCHTPGYMGLNTQVSEEDWLIGEDLGFHGSWGTAYPTNLRLMLHDMSEDEWVLLARQMRRDSPMAWVMLPKVSDEDLRAVYRFVTYLGPKGRPAPARLPAGVTPATDFLEFPEPH